MADPRPQPQARTRLAFQACRAALAAIALVAAAAAGCGGGKAASGSTSSSTASPGSATAQPAVIPVPADSVPLPPGPAGAGGDLGAVVFAKRCALCHGADGHGDGVASKGLNPKPRNFHDVAYMSTRTDAQLSEVIHKGKGVMPRWEGQLSEAEIQAVLKHVRSLGDGH
jgi:mono/diheme cytochrome c family protein